LLPAAQCNAIHKHQDVGLETHTVKVLMLLECKNTHMQWQDDKQQQIFNIMLDDARFQTGFSFGFLWFLDVLNISCTCH